MPKADSRATHKKTLIGQEKDVAACGYLPRMKWLRLGSLIARRTGCLVANLTKQGCCASAERPPTRARPAIKNMKVSQSVNKMLWSWKLTEGDC